MLVKCVTVQVDHRVQDGDVPLLGMSVHGGRGAVNVNYRKLNISKGFKSSDTRYLVILSDHI